MLAALNREWGTHFARWKDAMPAHRPARRRCVIIGEDVVLEEYLWHRLSAPIVTGDYHRAAIGKSTSRLPVPFEPFSMWLSMNSVREARDLI
jgi:hypothetical protein